MHYTAPRVVVEFFKWIDFDIADDAQVMALRRSLVRRRFSAYGSSHIHRLRYFISEEYQKPQRQYSQS